MIREGTNVKWKWGEGHGRGEVVETHKEKITRTINGESITRNGSASDKALVIKQDDGQEVLKLESEVERD